MKALLDGRSLVAAVQALVADRSPDGIAGEGLKALMAGFPRPSRILCVGKAAPALARAAARCCPDTPGLLYGTSPEGEVPRYFVTLYGDHPFPTSHNLKSTQSVERWVEEGEGPLLACVSGGGSSLLVHPREPWSLREKMSVCAELWSKGAAIRELNAVRARLSEVKAGGLRLRAGKWPIATAIWSDVGPRSGMLVSSAPTLPIDLGRLADRALAHYRVAIPRSLPRLRPPLRTREEDRWAVIYDARRLRGELGEALADREIEVREVPSREGATALSAARALRRMAEESSGGVTHAFVGAGEVRVDASGKDGRGGRCSHLAAEVALEFTRMVFRGRWAFAAIATDGVDGSAGGGAWVDNESAPRERDLREAISACDTGRLWERVGTLIPRKPTGNNLRDVWVLVVRR